MVNRRRFLQSGIVVSAASLPATSTLAAAIGATETAPIRLQRFVFDNRFVEAVDTAHHAARLGVSLAEFSGDLTRLWYDELDLQWKAAPMALAGVTTRQGLFVLETLAADRGMRVAYRGEHGVAANGCADHVLAGPAEVVTRAATQPGASLWGAVLGHALAHCPRNEPATMELELTTRAERVSARDVPLCSWIIAPRTAVAAAV
jgi:hypothetical protein